MSRRTAPPREPQRRMHVALTEAPARLLLRPSQLRRAPSRGSLLRRRLFVRAAKALLPVLALALLGAIAFWPELDGNPDGGRVSFRRSIDPRPEAMRVVNPRYRGVDDLGRPYTVTAAAAEQYGAEEVFDLIEPRGDILTTEGAWVFLRADRGRYDKPAHRLMLRGDVTIYHDNGTMFRTAEAEVQLNEGSAEGDMPVAAQGGFGTLTAEGFRLRESCAVVVFTCNAHAVLENEE